MTVEVIDRRVERTRAQLRSAMIDLIESRERSDITVQEVTRRAGVNRATFYQHYRDKDELLQQTIDALVDEIFDACTPILAGQDRFESATVHPSVVEAYLKIGKRPDLFRRLLGTGGEPTCVRIFSERSVVLALQALSAQGIEAFANSVPHEVRARASTAIFLSICGYWFENGCNETAEELAAWYWRLTHPIWFTD
jgi:AcrR family transcriptional regulator